MLERGFAFLLKGNRIKVDVKKLLQEHSYMPGKQNQKQKSKNYPSNPLKRILDLKYNYTSVYTRSYNYTTSLMRSFSTVLSFIIFTEVMPKEPVFFY